MFHLSIPGASVRMLAERGCASEASRSSAKKPNGTRKSQRAIPFNPRSKSGGRAMILKFEL
jgi:hypothetical protein